MATGQSAHDRTRKIPGRSQGRLLGLGKGANLVMEIVAINASYRGKKGYTEFLIGKLFEGASAAGAKCESVTLSELDIKRCTGCFTCQRDDRLFRCIHDGKDDAKTVFDKMRHADIIVFATPVYVFNMSTLLKTLLDRYLATSNCSSLKISKSGLFFHHIDEDLCSKPFATVICQDNIENETHKSIVSYFETYARFMDAKYVGSLVRRSAETAGHGRDEDKLNQYPVLKDIYDAFREAGKELVLSGRIGHSTQNRANRRVINIPPLVRYMARFPFLRGNIEKKAREAVG